MDRLTDFAAFGARTKIQATVWRSMATAFYSRFSISSLNLSRRFGGSKLALIARANFHFASTPFWAECNDAPALPRFLRPSNRKTSELAELALCPGVLVFWDCTHALFFLNCAF
jgi:hypothetical protein